MNKFTLNHIAFGLSMLIWLAFPLYMIYTYEHVLSQGSVYRFQPKPVDPYHPFKGRYIFLNYGRQTYPDSVLARQLEYGEKIYVSLRKGEDGFAEYTGVYVSPPDDSDYLAVEVRYNTDEEVQFELPFDEYFLNEKLAPEAETAYRNVTRNEKEDDIYVDVRIKEGMGIIEELYIQGKPIIEFLKQQ